MYLLGVTALSGVVYAGEVKLGTGADTGGDARDAPPPDLKRC